MSDPFKIDGPTCISFSGGRTSAYMLWRVLQSNGGLPDEAKVCFANTGKEDEATLRFVRDCADHWNVRITWVEYGRGVVDFNSASRNGEPFAAMIAKKRYLPNPVARFCTQDLKVNAINEVVGKDCDTMVGVRADEPLRVSKMRKRNLLVPLADDGVTQETVQGFWKDQKFDLGLKFRNGITALGNCDLCFLKGPEQIMGLIKDNPERATWWAQQESLIGATFRSDRPSYSAMQKFLNSQADMFNASGGIDCFCGD